MADRKKGGKESEEVKKKNIELRAFRVKRKEDAAIKARNKVLRRSQLGNVSLAIRPNDKGYFARGGSISLILKLIKAKLLEREGPEKLVITQKGLDALNSLD